MVELWKTNKTEYNPVLDQEYQTQQKDKILKRLQKQAEKHGLQFAPVPSP